MESNSRGCKILIKFSAFVKPRIHMITRVASNPRIVENCNLRFLRCNGRNIMNLLVILAALAILMILKPAFHMIARIVGDARIAQFCDQRSMRRNGNCPVQFASDRCVASDPCVRDRKFSISAIAVILASKGSRLSMNFSDRGLSFKR